uniref:sphingomyelin phosphodiesterase n=1 Tax=Aceria tosichella TaxID=561515 RepID=A0A6G1S4G0_9ACAR
MFTIRVLTLNCWGLWLGAKKRRQRIEGIVRYLRENNCDIVFLQEVWVTSDFEIIKNGTKDIYRFAHLFRSGSVLGSSGIVILCRWLPRVIHFEPYSLNGSPFYPWHGDWFAGKGIAYSRVDFDGLSLHLFSTHTHAYYKENEPVHDQYSVHRVCQSYQLARFITFIRDTACHRGTDGKDLLIVAGDMNSTSSELPYKILTTMAGLIDCFKTSRYSNPRSNIIHRHKLLSYNRRHHTNNNSDNDISNSSTGSGVGFLHNKFGDNLLVETIESYKHRIAQMLFDSDTDDEDVTYCHPKNSFTPNFLNYKALKPDDPNNNAKSASQTNISFSNGTAIKTPVVDENGSGSSISDNSSSTKQGIISSDSSIKSSNSRRTKNSPMKRIDFILCSLLTHGHCVVDKIDSESKDSSLDCSLSDHEPVMVELKICDISHDLMDKNRINTSRDKVLNQNSSSEHSRPLASVVEPKSALNQPEETTNQWVPERTPLSLSFEECNLQVMEETQDLLMQYYQYNRTSKTQLFYVALFMFVITLPTTTYYALSNELMPMSTIVFMWFAASFLFAICFLVGFLSFRYEQGAIQAILNDITCRKSVAKRYDEKNDKNDRTLNRGASIMNEHQL